MGIRQFFRSVRRRQDEDAVRDELRLHIELEAEDLVRKGLSPQEAHRRALAAFGGVERIRDESRDVRRAAALESWLRDVRYGLRGLLKRRAFALVVLGTVAAGTAGLIAVFTLVNGILLRPLAFPQSDRLVLIRHAAAGLHLEETGISSGLYLHYQEHARTLASMSLFTERVLNVRLPGSGTERVNVAYAGVDLFRVLGASPILGRLFTEEDGRQGFMNTTWPIPVLLSHDFWVGRFGGDERIVGRLITLNDRPREVVGILEEGFAFPAADTQVWMLWQPPRPASSIARNLTYGAVARLRRGITPREAEAELTSLLPRIVGEYDDATVERMAELRLRPLVVPLKDAVIGDVRPVLWTLFGAMVFLLLIAGANAAGLFLMRAEDRRREIALRLALGATSHQVRRLFLTEALLLTTAGTALGVAVAQGLLSATLAAGAVELPREAEIELDGAAVIFAAGVAVILALFYGFLPLRSQRQPLRNNLDSGARAASPARTRIWTREPLIAVQVALALTLMTGSALMLTTYRNLSRVDLGFSPDDVVTIDVGLPSSRASRHARIFRELAGKVRQLPGVEHAAAASFVPLTGGEHVFPVQGAGSPPLTHAPVLFKFFTPGYFQAVASPILEGASFEPGERITTPYPVLISAALAQRLYPGGRALGKPLRRLNADGTPLDLFSGTVQPFTIVGIVGGVRETSLRHGPAEIVYVPVLDKPVEQSITPLHMSLLIRTRLASPALLDAVTAAAQAVEPGLSLGPTRSLDSVVRSARAREGFVGLMLLLAGGTSLFLGIVGIYGSVAHRVGRRTREIGIRIALGATRAEVVWMVVSGSMWGVAAGAMLGIAMALVAARALTALLFGVQPADPATILAVTALLVGSAAAAAFLASRAAARVAPAVALRAE